MTWKVADSISGGKEKQGPRISYCYQKAQYSNMPDTMVIQERLQFKGASSVQVGQFNTEKQNTQNTLKIFL